MERNIHPFNRFNNRPNIQPNNRLDNEPNNQPINQSNNRLDNEPNIQQNNQPNHNENKNEKNSENFYICPRIDNELYYEEISIKSKKNIKKSNINNIENELNIDYSHQEYELSELHKEYIRAYIF